MWQNNKADAVSRVLEQILMKWGEYSSEVQLILRRSTSENNNKTTALNTRLTYGSRTNGLPVSLSEHVTGTDVQDGTKSVPATQNLSFDDVQGGLERNRDTRKSLTFGGFHGGITEGSTEVNL